MENLIAEFLTPLRDGSALLELVAIALLVGFAALLLRGVGRVATRGALSQGGGRRLAFPLLAILFLSALRFVAHHNHWPLHYVAVAVQLLWALAGIRMVVFAVQRAFPRATWLRGFGRWIALAIWLGVALDLLHILPELIAWLDADGFTLHIGKARLSLWEILQASGSILATLVVALWIGGVIEGRLMRSPVLDSSLKVVFSRATKAVLATVAVLVGMSMVGLDLTTLSVFGGALGVGLGFGMQKIASNYVSGFIILLDHSIRIGDVIQVGADRGEVRKITTRYTVLRAGTGSHYLLPNETLVGSVVLNDTFADPRVRVATRVQVAYNADVERAMALMEELARAEARVIADPPPRADLISFDDSGITLELGFWIADPENGNQEIRSNINRGILRRFREAGIEIPFPQREVRLLNPQ